MTVKKVFINKEVYMDKVHAAWIGKSIGGTIGTPYEGTKEFLDIEGFSTSIDGALPNDDLDLQLIWLFALEREGPWHFSARVLSEYWLSAIVPHWAEYGLSKANLGEGIPPMLSGELHNDKYKHSNGAWIRSEIWASLAPGFPGFARKFAFEDAQIDHGLGEGTYAELFTATLQSMAFFNSDMRCVVETALSSIPEDCRVARAVRLVLDEYDKGTPYREVREMLVKQSEDIGWFMAPANIGYVIIGLIYGEGDFKKSIIYATNCGDDTDCTAATVGATLGIFYGTKGIPADWREFVGDKIVTCCVGTSYRKLVPATCTEFTERIADMMPIVLRSCGITVEYTDGESVLGYTGDGVSTKALFNRSRWSFNLPRTGYVDAIAEYDRYPLIKPGESIGIRLRLSNLVPDNYNFDVKLILPEGFTADYQRSCYLRNWNGGESVWEATVTASDNLSALNHVYAILTSTTHMQPIIADFVFEA